MSELADKLNAERDQLVAAATNPHVAPLNEELKRLDPYLEVVWVGDRAPEGIPGMVPGRWHVRRTPPNGIDSYWAVETEDRKFRDLDMGVIEQMKRADLWRDGALEDLRRRRYQRMAAMARAADLEKEQLMDNFAMDLRAARRVRGEGGMKKKVPREA